jgi:spermidine synthase
MGGTATAAQILIIRELLVAFYGSELAIGVILANWLLLEAAGSYWARKWAEYSRRHVTVFAIMQVCIGLGCILSVLFIRSFKYIFHFSTGEILGFPYMAIISFLALAPIAILDGALFPFGCRGLRQVSRKQGVAGRVYLYQALGSFGAALCFVFWLIAWLNTIELASILFILNCCSAYYYLSATGQANWIKNSVKIILLLLLCMFFLKGNSRLHEFSSRLLWYEHDLQATQNSVYSNIAVISKEGQYTFFANGIPYATTPQPTALIEEKVHLPMLFHASPEKVLVIGGGAGGILSEILKHPVKSTDYTEQDPLIITCFEQFSTPLTEYELHHDSIVVHPQEGRLFLKKTQKKYDLIMVNFPIPSTLLLNRYYTVEFFRLAREHLAKDGLFSISLPGSETFLGQEVKNLNQTIYGSLKEVFPNVRILVGNENIFLGAVQKDLESISQKLLIDRLEARNISGGLITDWYLRYKIDQERFGPLAADIQKVGQQRVNNDQQPTAVIESMIFLNMISSPIFADFLAVAKNISFSACLVIVGIAVLTMIVCQFRSRKRPYIMASIFSTGFTGMFMHVTLILAFQIYYGYVYHYIGLLISLFMLGLAGGSYLAMRMSKPLLAPVEAGIVIHAMLVYAFFAAEPEGLFISSLAIYVFSFISGALTGAEYPLAVSRSSQSDKSVSIISGKLYAVDLIGGFWGAILTAVFLLPVMGIKNALLLIIVLKGGSLAMACIGEKNDLKASPINLFFNI